ncbi:MAG TPA: DUF4131 domain-containing protein, partial [Anaerolineae bacterium]|nr:DUF4131 domain-containing protein [Anaerolineae bacterium]
MIPLLFVFTIAYIIGIAIADSLHTAGMGIALPLSLISIGTAIHLVVARKRTTLRIASSALLFLLLGLLMVSLASSRFESGLLSKAARQSDYVTVEGTLGGDPLYRRGISNFDVKVERLIIYGQEWAVREKLKVKVRSDHQLRLYMGKRVRV